MADIFEEVEEGLRQDRLTVLWKKYGLFAYLAGALIIGGVAYYEYAKYSRAEAAASDAGLLETALEQIDDGAYEQAATSLEQLIAADKAISPMAAHYLAKVRLEGNGDPAAAASVLGEAASGDSASARLAQLKSVYLQADTLTRDEMRERLTGLLNTETAFGALATELMAAKAFEEGDIAFARNEFTFLQLSPNAPPGVRQRAAEALAALPPLSAEDLEALGQIDGLAAEETPIPTGEDDLSGDPSAETEAGETPDAPSSEEIE
ncbi:MAG: hypothetical protein AAGF20_03990 [Pseudomonadota bacterium]